MRVEYYKGARHMTLYVFSPRLLVDIGVQINVNSDQRGVSLGAVQVCYQFLSQGIGEGRQISEEGCKYNEYLKKMVNQWETKRMLKFARELVKNIK